MAEKIGLSWDVIPDLRRHFYQTYGTTMRGLQHHYNIDPDEYLAYVHDLPLETYLTPSPDLREMLLSLPQKRWIFTNADIDHAQRVINCLKLEGCFAGIIDVRAIEFACKPEVVAYQRALLIAREFDPQRCVILDDAISNLETAHATGFTTVLVGKNDGKLAYVDYSLPDLLSLPKVMPELWNPY